MNAALYDFVLSLVEQRGLAARREDLLSNLAGDVLEVGAGTGLNFPHYAATARVIAIDPDDAMRRRAIERARSASASIEVIDADAQALPFEDHSFDAAVGTLVMCTIPDPSQALAEVRRVLRPQGRYVFIEHVRAESPRLARWQDRFERPWRFVAGGCHPNRRTAELIEASGLKVQEIDRFELGLALTKPNIAGVAVVETIADAHDGDENG